MSVSLRAIAAAQERDSRFVAGWIGAEGELLRRRLGLDGERFLRLLISCAPRPSRFADDVREVASELGLDAPALASALREAAAVSALREQPAGPVVDLVTAGSCARARVEAAVAHFWSGVPRRWRWHGDLERVASLAGPVAVVALPWLSVESVSAWLDQHDVTLRLPAAERQLRALLVSWRGSSLVFVDDGVAAGERRLSAAHELGHVWLHYLPARRALLQRAPELFAAVDAHREVTREDRARAASEGARFGVQVHALVDGTGEGGTPEADAAAFALALTSSGPTARRG